LSSPSASRRKSFRHNRPNDKTIAWYHNSVGLTDLNAKRPECGIYLSLSDDAPTDLYYLVDGKFTLVWYRAASAKRK
jgi:hypothetical protein